MRLSLLSGALSLALTLAVAPLGVAHAQTPSPSTDATPTPPAEVVAPPVGTLSVTKTQTILGQDGSELRSQETTYRNSLGTADQSVVRTVTPPLLPITETESHSLTTTSTTTIDPSPPSNHHGN